MIPMDRDVPSHHNFVERRSETAELEKHLLSSCTLDISVKTFVLYGLGGIGKTQLAAKFAHQNATAFSSTLWLNAGSEFELRQSLAQYGLALWIDQGAEGEEPSSDARITLISSWLRQPDNRNWLLVLDDVGGENDRFDSPDASYIQKYLPGHYGSVLITTRLSHLSQLGPSMAVGKVDRGTSREILERWFGAGIAEELESDLFRLIDMLDGLPLALAQAGSYLRETGCAVSSYIQLYKHHWRDLMPLEDISSPILLNYRLQSMNVAWTSSFDAVRAGDRQASRLLLLWSCLDPTNFCYDLFKVPTETDGAVDWPPWLAEVTRNEARFLRAIQLMMRYSLVEKQQTWGYRMHPVVHKWMSHLRTPSEMTTYWQTAISVVGIAVPANTSPGFWVTQKRILAHSNRCLLWLRGEDGQVYAKEPSAIWYISKLADLYSDQGWLHQAEALYGHVMKTQEATLPFHGLTLNNTRKLGNVYARLHRFPEAMSMYQRVIEGCKRAKELQQDNVTDQMLQQLVLDICNDCANLCLDRKLFLDAEFLFVKALERKKRVLGLDHPSTLNTINDLGSLYASQGYFEDAKGQYMQALEGQKKILGSNHTFTLNTVNNIGLAYADEGRLQDGESFCRQALAGFETSLGLDHPLTLNIVRNIGSLLKKQGRDEEALKMYRRAWCGYQASLNVHHPLVVNTEREVYDLCQKLCLNEGNQAPFVGARIADDHPRALGY